MNIIHYGCKSNFTENIYRVVIFVGSFSFDKRQKIELQLLTCFEIYGSRQERVFIQRKKEIVEKLAGATVDRAEAFVLLSWNSLNPVAQLKLPELCCSAETPWTLLLSWNSLNPVDQLKLPEPSCSAETPWTLLISWNSLNPVDQLKLPEPSCSATSALCSLSLPHAYCSKARVNTGLAIVLHNATGIMLQA